MKSIGKTYLIDAELPKDEIKEGGIIIPLTESKRNYEPFIGYIKQYGTGFTEKQKKELLPIGTKVILNYNKCKRTKLLMDEKIYFIYNPEDILAVITQDQED